MPTRRNVLNRNQRLLEREESRRARQMAQAYNQARRELVGTLIDRWAAPRTLTPGQAVDLLRRLALLSQVDARLAALEREVGDILRDVITSGSELAIEQIRRELSLLAPELRPGVLSFARIDETLIERFLPAAMEEIQGITRMTRLQLGRELQAGLIQGESFPNLVRRLMAATPTGEGPAVWRNGQLSAERMTRRSVITAANAGKQEALSQINARGGVWVQKQWIATIGENTTQTCLHLHGEIVDADEPFEVTHEPRFGRRVMAPPAHWNCRSSIAMYHPSFEAGGLNTANMRSSAQAELRRRDE